MSPCCPYTNLTSQSGDQPFWGAMVHKAGAGPAPIPSKKLTADALAAGINEALLPRCVEKARDMSDCISKEYGLEAGAENFHYELDPDKLRCQLSPKRAAVWRIRRTDFRLSAFAATVLAHERLLDLSDLKLYRPREYEVDDGPWDPVTGGASALVETMGSMAMGIADMPIATLKALKIHPAAGRRASQGQGQTSSGSSTPSHSRPGSKDISSSDLRIARQDALQKIEPGRRRSPSTSSAGSSNAGPEAAAAQSIGDAMVSDAHTKATQDQPTDSTTDPHNPPRVLEKQKPFKFDQDDLDTLLSTGKGALRVSEAGFKSPLDFTLALAKGFHNAPKLYGDDTVRKPEKITDFRSGLKAAGKGLGLGTYDGITGLFTQPVRGAKKEGAAGFMKGVGKGIGGLILKPGAGVWGVPGYAAQGIYREMRKHFDPSVEGYIIAARTAQGFEDMQAASSEEYSQLIKDWDDVKSSIHKKKHVGEEKMEEIKARYHEHQYRSRSRSGSAPLSFLNYTHRRASSNGAGARAEERPSEQTAQRLTQCDPDSEDKELEEAIRQSVAETSRGNREEDAAIERAIRASVAELEEAKKRGARDADLTHVLHASIANAQSGNLSHGAGSAENNDSRNETASAVKPQPSSADKDDDADLQRAITASKDTPASPHEEELQRAIAESREAHEREEAAKEKAKEEEEVVMRYMLRQSEAEENLRRGKTGESSKSAEG